MAQRLSGADHDRISAAIRAAEATTSGEIYCVVARRVASYRWIPIALAAFAALLVPPIVLLIWSEPHRWPVVGEAWSSGNLTEASVDSAVIRAIMAMALVQLLVFIIVAAVTWPRRVRLALAPRAMRRVKVHHAARHQFLAQGLQATSDRTGLLLFIALDEREAVLLADEGIDSRVDKTVWEKAVGTLVAAAASGKTVDGLIEAIGQCGTVLAAHFPPEALPVNQLPDRVVEL